jgi:hypothetical protein
VTDGTCSHAETQLWRLALSNGVEQCRPICLDCDQILNAVAKQTVGEAYAALPRGSFAEARERYNDRCRHAWEQRWEAQRQQREAERRRENEAWWGQYNEYLRSPQWRSLRQRVLRRAGGVCEACLERRATQVHHRTYEHVFAEFGFELVAICDACHARLHPREDEAEGLNPAEAVA